jgi:hypothetical protein
MLYLSYNYSFFQIHTQKLLACYETNLTQYLSSVYSVNIQLHVSAC